LAGELFKFDQQGLMSELVTVTRLDHVALQIKGHRHVHSHQTVSLAEPVQLNPSIAANLRATAKGLHDKLISGDFSDVAENVLVNVDGAHESGVATLRMHFNDLLTAFGDLGVEHETVLVDGDRVAIGYQLNGVHTDTWQQPSGDILAPANKRVQVRVIDFLRFDASGKLSEYVSVVNTDDIAKQIKGD
jgi:predicted ester cyclase